MGAGNVVTKIFGMFDRIDDIVYEPVKLICDALRQPLINNELKNDKTRAEHNQQLEIQLKKFEADLELDRKRREMELSVEHRKIEEEINQMIQDNELSRREDMIQLEKKYREEMSKASTELGHIISSMHVETREKIFALYHRKEKEYLDLQENYRKSMYESINILKNLFPDGMSNMIVQNEISTQLKAITDRSTAFTNLMNEDMKTVLGIVNNEIDEIKGLASKYLQPPQPNQQALTQNVVDAIDSPF